MSVIVQKYGGSSVADLDKVGRVADKICATRDEGFDVVVVVSAMGKTTDELLRLARAIDPNPPRRELDLLLSTGERVSMTLLSMALQTRGCDAISFTGSQSGVLTNDWHFDARILEVRPIRVRDELARGRVVIVAGYQGMSYKREVTTLGRGGSDTSALAMAAALGAERAEIYSDVDGVYSADPRKVGNAVHLSELSYGEMQAMSDAGAKVLHAPAVAFAEAAGIPIVCRSTFSPGRETRIHGDAGARIGPVAVVSQPGIARVLITGDAAERRHTRSAIRKLGVTPFREAALPGDEGTELRVATAHVPDWGRAQATLADRGGVHVSEGFARVSVVCGAAKGLAHQVRRLVADGPAVHDVVETEHGLSALVQETDADVLTRRLHASLVESNDERLSA